jgi:predicted nucleic acid-binding protein
MTLTESGEPRFTLDSNILVYSFDPRDPVRHELALEIMHRSLDADCWLTLQSLSEFYSVTTRKGMLSPAEAAAQVADWLIAFPSTTASANAVRAALAASVARQASYWDALLVATAAEVRCSLALTEDMADGSVLRGVEIHNPFAASGGLTERVQALLGR